jgi:hypothetical protein
MTQLLEEVSRFGARTRDSALPPLLSLQVLEVSGCFFSRLESSACRVHSPEILLSFDVEMK